MRLLLPVAMLIACGCEGCQPPSAAPPAYVDIGINVHPKDKVDLLFMVDNSGSMDAMQNILRSHFVDFFKPFDDLAFKGHYIDFHIGVITSDYGAGKTGAPGCTASPGGQLGHLQAIGAKAGAWCKAPDTTPYIQYAYRAGGVSIDNLPMGQSLADTFTCMASVGAGGCGFEHQLESTMVALGDDNVFNRGFLRSDAALAVVFLTNEDDASAPVDSDVFDKNEGNMYGYEDSYSRQTRPAVVCGSPALPPPYDSSGGPLANCQPSPNLPVGAGPGRQFDVRRYINFFTRSKARGGVKVDPMDVILYAIDAPQTPFEVILSNPGTPDGTPYNECVTINENSDPPCVPVLQHSCVNPIMPVLFGDPAVRINTVVGAAPRHRIWSICDSDYKVPMSELSDLVIGGLGAGCIPREAIAKGASLAAATECSVHDVIDTVDSSSFGEVPACDGSRYPCWKLETKELCNQISPLGSGLTVDRNGEAAPEGSYLQASCHALGPVGP